jgi:hypothetical protein
MSARAWHPALGLYVVGASTALGLYLFSSADPEAALLMTLLMIVITLPSGLILAALLALAAGFTDDWGLAASFGMAGQVLTWALFTIVGFFQWRYLAPWVIRKLQTHT